MANDTFIKLVSEMRTTQKEYFKNRSQEALKTCKILEKIVDEAIIAFEKGAKQQELFNWEKEFKFMIPVMDLDDTEYTMYPISEFQYVEFDGYEEYKFVVHKGIKTESDKWNVSEFETGAKVATSASKDFAIKAAKLQLESVTKEKFTELLQRAWIISDQARAKNVQ